MPDRDLIAESRQLVASIPEDIGVLRSLDATRLARARMLLGELADELEQALIQIDVLETIAPELGSGSPMPMSAFASWLNTGSRGLSSHAMVGALTGSRMLPGKPVHADSDRPHDSGDFWRCENLLRAVPEAREHMDRIAALSPEWAALVAHWDELTGLNSQRLTARIRVLTRSERAEGNREGAAAVSDR